MKSNSKRSYFFLCTVALLMSLAVLLVATSNSANAQSGGTPAPISKAAGAVTTAQATTPAPVPTRQGTAPAAGTKSPGIGGANKGVKPSPTPKGNRRPLAPAVIIPNGVNVSSPNNTSGTAVNWTEAAAPTANTFTLNITNSGPDVTTGTLTLSVDLTGISGLTFSAVQGGNATVLSNTGFDCSTSTPTKITCIYTTTATPPGKMAAGYSQSITFQMNVGKTSAPSGNFPVTLAASTAGTTSSDNVFFNITLVPDLTVSLMQHNGNGTGAGSNFITNSNNGTITARIQNVGDGTTSGTITLDIYLPATCNIPTNACAGGGGPYNTGFSMLSWATEVGGGLDPLTWACVSGGSSGPVVCTTTGGLPAGHFAGVVLTVTAPATPATNLCDEGVLPNPPVNGGEPTVYNTNNTLSECGINVVGGPDLTLTKTHVDPFVGGVQGQYVLTISNKNTAGPTTGNIVVTDTLPSGLTFVSSTTTNKPAGFPSANFVCSGTTSVSCTASSGTLTLQPNASITLTLNVAVPACTGNTPPTIGAPNPNKATVTTPNGTNGAIYNTNVVDSAGTTNVKCVTLAITKTHTDPFSAGVTPQTYTITVTNNGNATTDGTTAGNITVTDTLPAGMTYDAANTTSTDYTCSAAGQVVTCASMVGKTLAPTASDTITLAVTLNSANTCATSPVSNTASVQYLNQTPVSSLPDSTTIHCADLKIVKTASTPFSVGASGGSYTIVVTNWGTGLLPKTVGGTPTVLTVTDIIPPQMSLVSIAPPNSPTGWNCAPTSGASPTVTCTYDLNAAGSDLAAGASLPTLTLTVSPAAQGSYLNQSSVAVSNNVLFIPSDADDASNITTTATAPPAPIISVLKQAMNKLVGGPATQTSTWFVDPTDALDQGYQITVTNTGTLTAAIGTVTINDTLSTTGITFSPAGPNPPSMNANSTGWNCSTVSATQFSCTNTAPITIGASLTIKVPVDVMASAIGTDTNTATLSGSPSTQSQAIVTVQPAPTPNLTMKKTHVTDPTSGGSVTWTIVVTNTGSGAASAGFTITDTLPCTTPGTCTAANSFTFVSGGGSGGFNACTLVTPPPAQAQQTVSCVYPAASPALAPNGAGTATLTITATAPTTLGNYTNNVSIAYNGPTNTASDVTPVVAGTAVDMKITKSHTDPFTVGTPATYNITVQNIGPGTATAPAGGFKITDAIPTDLTFTGFVGGGAWTCLPAAPQSGPITITCTDSVDLTVAGGGTSLTALTINVNPTAPTNGAPVNNVVKITNPPAGDINALTDTTFTDPTNINGACVLTLSKTAASNFQYGQNGSYNLLVTNTGTSPCLAPITVQDTLSAGLTFVAPSGSPGGFSCVAGTPITCTRSSNIPAGGTDTIALNVKVGANGSFTQSCSTGTSALGIQNQATVQNSQSNSSSNTICTAVTSGTQPDLIISKSASVPQVAPGGNVTYTLTVTNQGGVAENGTIVVTDTLNPNLTFQSGTGTNWGCSAAGQTVSCTLTGGLQSSQSSSVNVTVLVSNSAVNGTVINNTASISPCLPDESNCNNNTSNTATVNVNSAAGGSVDPNASSVCVSPQSGLIAGSSSAIVTVTVRDNSTQHSLMSGLPVTLSISSGTGGSITSTNPQNTTNGIAQFTVRDSSATTLTFQATVNGVTIAGTGGQPGCSPSGTWTTQNTTCPTVANSSITPASATVAAGSTVTFTVTTLNSLNAPVAATVTVSASTVPSGVTLTINPSSMTTNPITGQATFTATASGNATITFTITATCIGGGTITLSTTPTITWGTGSSSGGSTTNTFTISTNYTCLPADNITTATLTTNIKVTSTGNGVSGKTITLTGNPTLGTISPSSGTTDSSGNVTFTIRSATQGTETFTAVDTTDNVTFPTLQITFNAPGTKVCVNPNATLTPVSGQPSEAIVITRLLCDRDGPGFGYARYAPEFWMHFNDRVTVLGKTTRVPGLQARDLCIHKGGPTWYLVKTPLGFVVWANANFIRVGLVNFRNLPVLVAPAPPGAQGAPQAAIVGPISGPPPTH